MGVLTIKIPDEELRLLNAVTKMQRRTKTEYVRSLLRPALDQDLVDSKVLTLDAQQYGCLWDMLTAPMSEKEREGRRKLDSYADFPHD